MEPKTRDVHVLRLRPHFRQLQNAYALSNVIGADPARLAGEVNLCG